MRYLEIDSTYRNRNDWPLVSQFEIPISQTGTKDKCDALDPVCTSDPIIEVWTSNNMDKQGHASIYGTFSIQYDASSVLQNLTVNVSTGQRLQCAFNYYRNLSLRIYTSYPFVHINPIAAFKITEYAYLGVFNSNDVAIVTLDISGLSAIPSTAPTPPLFFSIVDPTTFADPYNPYLFVPFACYYITNTENYYNKFILYNETINEYRPIKFYNSSNSVITLITSGSTTNSSGPLSSDWHVSDSFSIRYAAPLLPSLGNNSLQILSTYTYIPLHGSPIIYNTTENIVILTGSTMIAPDKYFKNCALRITNIIYNYIETHNINPEPALQLPIGESVVITNNKTYEDGSGNIIYIIYLSKSLGGPLVFDGTMKAEILDFSYDNFNPFIYNGSIVSQQNMSCYEISLYDISIPTIPLLNVGGGTIINHPYVYVEISNVSASGAGVRNILYSNNPNSIKVTFRCPIPNATVITSSLFLSLAPNNLSTQTIKFKPDDNLFFCVRMPDGELITPIYPDTLSPKIPNPNLQISASFALKKL